MVKNLGIHPLSGLEFINLAQLKCAADTVPNTAWAQYITCASALQGHGSPSFVSLPQHAFGVGRALALNSLASTLIAACSCGPYFKLTVVAHNYCSYLWLVMVRPKVQDFNEAVDFDADELRKVFKVSWPLETCNVVMDCGRSRPPHQRDVHRRDRHGATDAGQRPVHRHLRHNQAGAQGVWQVRAARDAAEWAFVQDRMTALHACLAAQGRKATAEATGKGFALGGLTCLPST
eukprot:1160804-Pelagomonas_calceolata.AAC.28